MRVTQIRVVVSTRITSAPRCASWSVQNGPAHTQVKSATRMPASGARAMSDDSASGELDGLETDLRQHLGRVLAEAGGGRPQRPRRRAHPVRRAAGDPVLEQLHRRPFRIAHEVDEAPPLVLLDAAEEDPAVAALHEAERLDRLRAEARCDETAVGIELEGELEDRRDAFLGGDLDVLTVAARSPVQPRAERSSGPC